jgi:hypothetical protein
MEKTTFKNLIATHDEFQTLLKFLSEPDMTSFQHVTIDKITPHPTNPEQYIVIDISCETAFTLWYVAKYVGASVAMEKYFERYLAHQE